MKNTISRKTIRQFLTDEEKTKKDLLSLEESLRTLRLEVNFTSDHIAEAIKSDSRLMKNIKSSLVNSFSFRKKISEEIFAYLLEKEEKNDNQA